MANIVSDRNIASVARKAGFSNNDVPLAVAVALAESGGNADVVNDKEPDGSTSYGLWQINSVHKALLATGDWRDPQTNARMAFQIFSAAGRKWTPWGAFNKNRHLLYMPRGHAALVALGLREGIDVIEDLSPLDEIRAALGEVTSVVKFVTNPHTWLRMGTILIGVILLSLVLWQAVKAPVITAAKTAIKVVPQTKAVSKVVPS